MKLSIIVPVYNVEAYLHRCIDSILNQTFTDFELILVDDGSPDACGKICDEYALQDRRVKVIHKKNGGLSDARNAGLEVAKGEYIGFVDSDDRISPEMYEKLITTATETGADIVAGGLSLLNEQGEIFERLPKPPKKKFYTRDDFIYNFYPSVWMEIWPTVTDKIFLRHLFNEIRFPLGKIHEDIYIQLALYNQSSLIVTDHQYGYYYYAKRPESITNSNYSSTNFAYTDWSLHNYFFFKTHKLDEQTDYALVEYLVAFLRNFFMIYLARQDLRHAFSPYEKQFRVLIPKIFLDKKVCKMHKLVVMIMYLNTDLAYQICKKYLPSSLPAQLR